MAYGDYYNPSNKVVVPGAIVYADDLNKINSSTDAGFAQVASDLDSIAGSGFAAESKAWATAAAGTRPDVLINDYSSKAYANEAKGWASSDTTVVSASTGAAISGSVSAKSYSSQAGVSASNASTSASSASTSASSALGYKNSAESSASTATTKASEASSSASLSLSYKDLSQKWANELENVVVADGKYSAFHWAQKAAASSTKGVALTALDTLTPASDKIPYFTGSNTASLATITSAGRALIDDADAAAQRVTLGLGNVPNVNCQNADNITSGTIADARIASTITRDTEVNTATQSALDLKANLISPQFTGTPVVPTAAANTNTTQAASTAFVVGQASSATPTMDGVASAGNGFLYTREGHVHPTDTSRAPLVSPQFTGVPLVPTASPGTNTTQAASTAFVTNAVSSKVSSSSPTLTGTVTVDGSTVVSGTSYLGVGGASIRSYAGSVQIAGDSGWIASVTKGGTVTMTSDVGVSNSSLVKTALNASGSAPIYACRAWVCFSGSGTVGILNSANVSSITDNGTGDYTINFTTAMPNEYYSVSGWARGTTSASPLLVCSDLSDTKTSTSLRIRTRWSDSKVSADSPEVTVSIFG